MCEYCDENPTSRLIDMDSGQSFSQVELCDGFLCIDQGQYYNGETTSVKINFCPMCGKKLGGDDE